MKKMFAVLDGPRRGKLRKCLTQNGFYVQGEATGSARICSAFMPTPSSLMDASV